jgi:DNA-binding MarR family transcriptional regulator
MDRTATFLEVFSRWRTNVGDLLAGEDPKILVRIVELSSTNEGISQRALQEDLKISQSRLSKLSKKLAVCSWVVLRKSSSDRRVLLMTATDHAKARVEWLRTELSAIDVVPTPAAPRRDKAFKLPAGQKSLFEDS